MRKYHNVVQDAAGNAIAYPDVYVRLRSTGALATLYSDDGVTTIANPLTGDALGYFECYLADGNYDIEIQAGGESRWLLDEEISGLDGVSRQIDPIVQDVSVLKAGQSAGVVGYATRAALDADLAHPDGTVAYVTEDPTSDNNTTYRKSGASGAGSWVQTSGSPVDLLREKIAAKIVDVLSEYVWAVNDGAERAAIAVDAMGRFIADTIITNSASVRVLEAARLDTSGGSGDNWVWGIEDQYQQIVFGLQSDGSIRHMAIDAMQSWINSNKLRISRTTLPKFVTDYELNHLLVYGQSLSVGWNAKPAITLAQQYASLMLSSGLDTYVNYDYSTATLVPLVEQETTSTGETPVSGALDTINELILAENQIAYTDHKYQMVGSVAGVPGETISNLIKGSVAYTRIIDSITKAYQLAKADGKPYALKAVGWIQGETDIQNSMDPAIYQNYLKQLRADMSTDASAITGQSAPIRLLSYQTSSACYYNIPSQAIPMAQWEASRADPNITLVTPIYHLDYADGVHLTNESSRWLGAYIGLAYKRVVIDGQIWTPLAPRSKIIQGRVIIVIFDVPRAPLVLDAEWVTDPGNYGFGLVDSTGASLAIQSVSLAGPDRVKIVATADIPTGAKVRYAWSPISGQKAGRLSGNRGCLRDSAGDDLTLNINGKVRPMHNWCIISEV